MFRAVLMKVAEQVVVRPDPMPRVRKTRTRARSRRADDYPRAASDAERRTLAASIRRVAERIDDGIAALEGTNEAWAAWEMSVTGASTVAATTVPNRFSVWRRLAPPAQRFHIDVYDVQIHLVTDEVGGQHVRRLGVTIYPHGSATPLIDGAAPARTAVEALPTPAANLRGDIAQLFRLLLRTGAAATEQLAPLAQFVARMRRNIARGKRIRIVVTATAITISLACTAWLTWRYRHFSDGSIRAVVNAGPVMDERGGHRRLTGWAALVQWTDRNAQPDDTYVVYRDGKLVREITAKQAWQPTTAAYQWADTGLRENENHTYRLGKKIQPIGTIYVTAAMDLKPCWRCLADYARGRLDDAFTASALNEAALHGYGLTIAAGEPFRFGGRLDKRNAPPEPLRQSTATPVRVDFGDGSPVHLFDSDNVVHTYLKPGTYTVKTTPVDPSYLAPAPQVVTVTGQKLALRNAVVMLAPVEADSSLRFTLTTLPDVSTNVPLRWCATELLRDLDGDYLENIDISVSYGDEAPPEYIRLSDMLRRNPDGSYDILRPLHHTWRAPGDYPLTIIALSHEQGTLYSGFGKVNVQEPRDSPFVAEIRALYASDPNAAVWYVAPDAREGYVRIRAGQQWHASLRPWLDLIAADMQADTSKLRGAVCYGRLPTSLLSSGTIGDGALFPIPGHTWVKFLFREPDRPFAYVGETNVIVQ